MPHVPVPSHLFALPRDADRQRRRLRLLLGAVEAWLAAQACDAARRRACVALAEPLLAAWLDARAADGDPIDGVLGVLDALPDRGASAPSPRRGDVGAAFARALLRQAETEVEREADRAGRADILRALRPWLDRPLPVAEAASLAESLGLGEPALRKALDRLRRRWRQRVDAGLALWSAEPAARGDLRRRLHAFLVAPETSP